MREINPRDIDLFKKSFSLAIAIMLFVLFAKFILIWIWPTLILSIIIFFILKYVNRNNF